MGSAARGSTVTYYFSTQNDAPFPDTLRLRGSASDTRFKVTYTAGGTDITSEFTAATYTTPPLAPGATFTVKVQVKVRATSPAGSSLNAEMTVKSDRDPAIKDTVKFVTGRAGVQRVRGQSITHLRGAADKASGRGGGGHLRDDQRRTSGRAAEGSQSMTAERRSVADVPQVS